MSLVTFKAVCVDALDAAAMGEFWAKALGYELETLDDGDVVLRGSGPGEEVWINTVPEAKTVWHRAHLDLRSESLERFADCEQVSGDGEFPWTTFRDPEGGEFCVFVHEEIPEQRLKDIVVKTVDYRAISQWWTDVMGGALEHDEKWDYSHLDQVPGSSLESIDFVPSDGPKTVKNRIHWDVTLNEDVTAEDLVAKGATVLQAHDGWTVMADPEGNEFCVFARS